MNAPVWFHDHGVGVFPTKPRSKEPACRWLNYACPRDQAARLQHYGVRLGRGRRAALVVIDTDSPAADAWVAAHAPATPFTVRTARGVHRYYTVPPGDWPAFIHRDGLTIEFKGDGCYVVGPGSVHPSGAVYTADDWSWRWEDLPCFPAEVFRFDDRGPAAGARAGAPYEIPEEIHAGERHYELFRLLRSLKAQGCDHEEVRTLVSLANTHRCQPPLREDAEFERWFARAWRQPDRPLDTLGDRVPIALDSSQAGWL